MRCFICLIYKPHHSPAEGSFCHCCPNRQTHVKPEVGQAALLHLLTLPLAGCGFQACLSDCLRPGSGIPLPLPATSEDKSHDATYTWGLGNRGKHIVLWQALADSATPSFEITERCMTCYPRSLRLPCGLPDTAPLTPQCFPKQNLRWSFPDNPDAMTCLYHRQC